jgi:hypothetical protein
VGWGGGWGVLVVVVEADTYDSAEMQATTIYVSILLYVCPRTTVYVSSCCCICPHTTVCVLILLYVCPLTCILLYLYPHTATYFREAQNCRDKKT